MPSDAVLQPPRKNNRPDKIRIRILRFIKVGFRSVLEIFLDKYPLSAQKFVTIDLSDNKISGSGSAVLILNSRNIILSLLL